MRWLYDGEYSLKVLPLLQEDFENGGTVAAEAAEKILQWRGSETRCFVYVAGEGIFGHICRKTAGLLKQNHESVLQWEPMGDVPNKTVFICGGILPAQGIARMNELALPVICLGMLPENSALRCDMTVLFYGVEARFFCCENLERCGRIELVEKNGSWNAGGENTGVFTQRDARQLLRPPNPLANKYDFGHVVTLGGSRWYGGAPFLAATAALRMGAGLSTLLIPAMGRRLPGPAALMVYELSGAEVFQKKHLEEIRPYLAKASAVLCGPGVSKEAEPEVIREVLSLEKPVILDADALNILSMHPEMMESRRSRGLILTPHAGELKRLIAAFMPEALKLEVKQQAHLLAAKLQAVVVQKGHYTWVHDGATGKECMILSGNVALATAGTGDVLAGGIGALAAQMSPYEAACLGAYIHGLAADMYPYASRSMVADDLLDLIPQAISRCSVR